MVIDAILGQDRSFLASVCSPIPPALVFFPGWDFPPFSNPTLAVFAHSWVSQQILLLNGRFLDQDGLIQPSDRFSFIWMLTINLVDSQWSDPARFSSLHYPRHEGNKTVQRECAAVQVECIDHMHVVGARLVHLSTVWFGWDKWVNRWFCYTPLSALLSVHY